MSYTERTKTLNIPMVPLRGVVIFPSVPLSFDISHPRSVASVNEAMENSDMVFLIAQRDAEQDWTSSPAELYGVGTVARITKLSRMSDGSVNISAEGVCRGELTSVSKHQVPYATVICRSFDFDPDSVKAQALTHEVLGLFEEYLKKIPNVAKEIEKHVRTCSNPAKLADLIAATLLLRFDDKQDILEEYEPMRRLELLAFKMQKELDILEQEFDIHKKVRARIDEHQREYYMREQIKVLQEELGEDDREDDDFQSYASKILLDTTIPSEVSQRLMKEAEKLMRLPYGSAERSVLLGYLDICLQIPWSKSTEDRLDIAYAGKVLDKDHYGLSEIKERILEYLSVMKLTPAVKSQIICLVGAPGVGKTSVASSIARAMDKKFVRVSLGGVRDEADIRGHRKTYIASMPGRIVNALIESGVSNPLILLDEIDKLTHDAHGDPASALLEVLDPDQNKNFRDHFVEIPVDLSSCLFICTANTLDTIPKPLLDRMEVIELHSYTREEKLEIAKKYLLPKQIKQHGLTKKILTVRDDALLEMIDRYTFEAGVRSLERAIAKLCRKVARAYVEGEKESFRIKAPDVYTYLGARKYDPEALDTEDRVGIVNGLAYTEAGGELLKVEAVSMQGSGKLELTGSLGEVMKESARIAYSIVRARANGLGIDPDFYKNTDIHVHFPEGAVPKDGPSAGVTLVTALVSELSKSKVKRGVAMTGEVSLSGRVIAIGGLREKVVAAKKSGIKKVLIPYENRQDMERLDGYIKDGVEFILCKTVDEVLIHALVSDDKHDDIPFGDYSVGHSTRETRGNNEVKHSTNNP